RSLGLSRDGSVRVQGCRYGRPVRRWMAQVVIGLAMIPVTGCVEKVSQTSQYNDLDGTSDAGKVLPRRNVAADAAAYAESEERLNEVEWGVIEKKGPKPIWEQLGDHREEKRRAQHVGHFVEKETEQERAKEEAATTQQVVGDAVPATRPVVASNDRDLPVKM